jgi:Ca-activated chloride channel family protein
MSFAWPVVLLSLLVLPVLLGGYVWAGRRRRRQAVSYSSVALIKAARPARSAWRRHVPFALMLAALGCLGVATARPQITADVPVDAASVILAVDVSGSMCSTDVQPNRLSAAQAAVRKFVQAQNSHTRIGLVAFSSFAQLAVAPTTNHGDLLKAIDSLTTGRGTVIGSAILKSVDAIAAIDPHVAPADSGVNPELTPGADGSSGTGPGGSGSGSSGQPPSTQNKSYAPEIVVLLTDGANTRGVTPVDAAKVAAARGVRVYPIGFGTTQPTMMMCTAEQLGGTSFENLGPGRFGGGTRRGNALVADVQTLRQVASITGGTYFAASDADQLQDVLGNLPRHVHVQQRHVELSVGLAALAAMLVLLAMAAAARWSAFPT